MAGNKQLLARTLRRRRADLGLTQAAAAERCGLSVSTYAAVERAERDVRDSTLHDLGHGLGFDASAAYWDTVRQTAEALTIDGTIHRIERTETDEGYFRTVFDVSGPAGTWTITQERTHPPGPLRAGEVLVFAARRTDLG